MALKRVELNGEQGWRRNLAQQALRYPLRRVFGVVAAFMLMMQFRWLAAQGTHISLPPLGFSLSDCECASLWASRSNLEVEVNTKAFIETGRCSVPTE